MSSDEQQSETKRGLSDRLKALRPDSGRPAQPAPQRPGGTTPWQNAIYALIAIFALSTALSLLRSPGPEEISYTELKQAVREGRVAQVTFEGQQVRGRFIDPAESQRTTDSAKDGSSGETSDETQEANASKAEAEAGAGAETGGESEGEGESKAGTESAVETEPDADNSKAEQLGGRFISTLPQVQDPGLLDLLEQHDVEIDAESTETGLFSRVLITLLPWLLILGLFLYLSNRMQQRMMAAMARAAASSASANPRRSASSPKRSTPASRRSRGLRTPRPICKRSSTICPTRSAFVPWEPNSRRVSCWSDRPAPARPCWREPSPARLACPSSTSAAPSSSRCSSASAPRACAISLTMPRSKAPIWSTPRCKSHHTVRQKEGLRPYIRRRDEVALSPLAP